MNPSSNLILIGMPGSGKSTLGVLAAKVLGLDFLDTDLLLQRRVGLMLHEILVRDGPTGFLAAEDQLLSELTPTSTVLSTGGSAVYHQTGMSHLAQTGTVVWIDVPFQELERRLGDMTTRGVVLQPGQTLQDLYRERRPLYEKWATVRLEAGREDLETTVERLVSLVKRDL